MRRRTSFAGKITHFQFIRRLWNQRRNRRLAATEAGEILERGILAFSTLMALHGPIILLCGLHLRVINTRPAKLPRWFVAGYQHSAGQR